MVTFEDIKHAQSLLKGVIVDTPCIDSPRLSDYTGANVHLKLEIFQATGAFKERGAYVKLKSLTPEQLKKGVIAMSAGNHALAVAYHSQKLNVPATIVMPVHTPNTKIANTEKCGAEVILSGKTLEDARIVAEKLARERGLTFIHPYNDPYVIAGQGTIGLEILAEVPQMEALILPIGGGGLSAGVSIAAKTLNPNLKIYGVEVEGYASLAEKLFNHTPSSPPRETLAEGIAVKSPGDLAIELLKDKLEDVLVVNEGAIEFAIDLLMRKQNIVSEGAGAAGVAALIEYASLFTDQTVGTVICGGNIDSRVLSAIALRGRMRDGRIARLRIQIDDVPGVLEKVAGIFAQHGANIIELKHQRFFYETPVKMADLDATIETRNEDHIMMIMESFEKQGYRVMRLSGSGGEGS